MTEIVQKTVWKGVPLAERQRFLAQELSVPHPAMVRVLRELHRSVERCQRERKGRALLVLAGSGCGKSHLINTLKRQKPADHSGDVSYVPIVSFSIPSRPTQRAMGAALLRALEHPRNSTGSADEMFERVVLQVRAIKTEMIMIDNVHDIPERRSTEGIMHVGNWIRDLIDRTECLIVMLGTPAARQITNANAQLRRRVSKQMVIRYFDIEQQSTAKIFKRFLFELDKRLPLAHSSQLDEPKIMQRMYWATAGITDYILQLVGEALSIAVESGRERIDLLDLERAFSLVFQDSAQGRNPFSEDGPRRLLDQQDEPFYNWFDKSNPHMDEASSRGG